MIKKIKVLLALICFVLLVVCQGYVHADALGYGVKALIPDNQRNKEVSYFDLKTSPNMSEIISVAISNNSDKVVSLEPVVNLSKTNFNGVMDYQNPKLKSDVSLPMDISKIVTPVEKKIDIAAHTTQEVKFQINMPDRPFNGQLVGGIVLKDLNQKSKKSGVSNVYAFVVGIVLHGNQELDKDTLALGDVVPDQNNYRNVITSELRNTSAKILSKLSVETTVTKKNSDKILYAATKEKMMLAPNSILPFPTSLKNKSLKPGHYTIHIAAKTKDQNWHFDKDFEIKGEVAKKLNAQAVELEKDYTWLYMTAIGILIILLACIFFYIRHKNKEQKKLKAELNSLRDERDL